MGVQLINGPDRPSLWFYGMVGDPKGVVVDDVRAMLGEVGPKTDVDIHIYSDGGDFFEAMAIKSLLAQHRGKKFAIVDGLAASAASLIFQAATVRTMAKNARQMIHEARGYTDKFMTAAQYREVANEIESLNKEIFSIYSDRWKGSPEDLKTALSKDTWLSDQDSVRLGLADKVGDMVAIAAKVDGTRFQYANVPDDVEVADKPELPTPNMTYYGALNERLRIFG